MSIAFSTTEQDEARRGLTLSLQTIESTGRHVGAVISDQLNTHSFTDAQLNLVKDEISRMLGEIRPQQPLSIDIMNMLLNGINGLTLRTPEYWRQLDPHGE